MEAKAHLATEEFDAILLDYDLQDGKGVELFPTLDVLGIRPIVIATSSHVRGNQELREAGADFVCAKKEFGDIDSIMERAMNHRKTLKVR